ncbi:hypothetical protein OGR47_07975 [Methylocystis sp. MJC1]|jgi:hypothetical protein|uniref:hypothetical protein n=1 Tax=Methylocystis sp. MJC1 TaxID=2654282 RepID=UPI0013EE1D38|nr:hypothetical protein [Methylocystis sp. MJC1]KAF2989200.1 hypothetical protein MJC1_03670 [Methylocystis sp. MJC1]MBU6526927.1 hypothetical protein [Methylocystis sp. MJC1]UZX13365.1 hypothetical protein OGR47_07975 [Methylocystis sp. MJC1]
MPSVKGHFAAYPYARDQKPIGDVVRRGASGEYTAARSGKSEARKSGESVTVTGAAMQAGARSTANAGEQVLDEKAKRAARNKRIDQLMTVIEALHGDTLAELAK